MSHTLLGRLRAPDETVLVRFGGRTGFGRLPGVDARHAFGTPSRKPERRESGGTGRGSGTTLVTARDFQRRACGRGDRARGRANTVHRRCARARFARRALRSRILARRTLEPARRRRRQPIATKTAPPCGWRVWPHALHGARNRTGSELC